MPMSMTTVSTKAIQIRPTASKTTATLYNLLSTRRLLTTEASFLTTRYIDYPKANTSFSSRNTAFSPIFPQLSFNSSLNNSNCLLGIKTDLSCSTISSTPSIFIRSYSSSSSSSQNAHPSSASSSSNSSSSSHASSSSNSISDRLRILFRKYGWASVAIYFLLSGVDLAIVFLIVMSLGADHVRTMQDWLLQKVGLKRHHDEHQQGEEGQSSQTTSASSSSPVWTALALAYTIHKTLLLPVRLGLTAWCTPIIVRTLQRWGWKVGGSAAGATSVTK